MQGAYHVLTAAEFRSFVKRLHRLVKMGGAPRTPKALQSRAIALEYFACLFKDISRKAAESAINWLSCEDLELLISAFGADREGRPVTGGENAARRTYTAVLNSRTPFLRSSRRKVVDTAALRLCLDRICPPCKERLVEFPLADISEGDEAAAATASILSAASQGQITPGEAELLARTVQIHTQIIETRDLARRVSQLENVITNAFKPEP